MDSAEWNRQVLAEGDHKETPSLLVSVGTKTRVDFCCDDQGGSKMLCHINPIDNADDKIKKFICEVIGELFNFSLWDC